MPAINRNILWAAAVVLLARAAVFADTTVSSEEQKVTTTQYDYDSRATYDIDSAPLRYTYDANTSDTQNSSSTTTQYDAQDRLTEPTPGNTTTYQYDAQDRVTQGSTTDTPSDDNSSADTYNDGVIGGRITYQYDSMGRDTVQESDPAGRTTTYTYDPGNGVTGSNGADPLGNTTRYQYDSSSRTIDMGGDANSSDGDVTQSGSADFRTTQSFYDETGKITLDTGTINYLLNLKLEDVTTSTTLYDYNTSGTLNSGVPVFFTSPTMIPLDDLNDTYRYSYDLTISGPGGASSDFKLVASPLPSSWVAGAVLLATLGAKKRLLRARC